MKYFIIAGEASGDLHGSNLAKQIALLDVDAEICGWGGDKMIAQKVEVKKHIRELAFMGFVEVLMNLKTIMRNFKLCKQQILEFKPDALILIDYPGFNLRMAAWAKEQNLKVIYYISPQVWAWKKSRVKKIRRDVDFLFPILPFEQAFYQKYDVETEYYGHPLIDAIEEFKKNPSKIDLPTDKPVLALLPGSRKQELKRMLPLMLQASAKYKNTHRIVVGAVSLLPQELYNTTGYDVTLLTDQSYNLLSNADAAFVKSGTSTLEAALFRVPQVVCYKANAISVWIARRLVGKNIKYISLANLIVGKEICTELIQSKLNVTNMTHEMDKIISPSPTREKMLSEYDLLYKQLGGAGAPARVAKRIVEICKK